MTKLSEIQAPIQTEMNRFEPYFKEALDSKIPLLDTITNYVYRRKGKQLRPILVFLSAKLTGGTTQKSYTAASLVELLHTATLIHDDIVDEAFERRGFFSVFALWKAKLSVLTGDFILAQGLSLAVRDKATGLLGIVASAMKEVAEGELLQMEKARKLDITEEVYFEVIRKKTATLIAACTSAGAESNDSDPETIEKMRQFGEYLGISFQIKDDLFDYKNDTKIGKPTGNDIKEKKLTLPLIYTLQKVTKKERKYILNIVRKHNKDKKKIAEIVKIVNDNGGMDYCKVKMIEYKNKALEIINEFEDSEAKTAMLKTVAYVIDREK